MWHNVFAERLKEKQWIGIQPSLNTFSFSKQSPKPRGVVHCTRVFFTHFSFNTYIMEERLNVSLKLHIEVSTQKVVKVKAHKRVINGKTVKVRSHYRSIEG